MLHVLRTAPQRNLWRPATSDLQSTSRFWYIIQSPRGITWPMGWATSSIILSKDTAPMNMVPPWRLTLRMSPKANFSHLPVTLAAQFLQCIADITSAPRDPLLSPALLIIIYSTCFLVLLVEMWFARYEVRQHVQEERDGP
jgi:hypothetical protein